MPTGEKITPVNIEEEMKTAYLDYAMSVIVGRALPDVRDGLKPVHRRILYAMFREGLLSTRRYSKSAGVVGEVIKKYHPHGDAAVYDALVRMVQDFNMRYPLVDGQGNFGSVDGDPPAAYRYTEVRLTRLAEENGFTHGWVFDSHVLWKDPYPLLQLMAQNSERLRLGTCVTNPATRDPSVTASTLAVLQVV